MVINSIEEDKAALKWEDSQDTESAIPSTIYTNQYVYMGAHFFDDGMRKQAQDCRKQVNKFACYVTKNQNEPLILTEMTSVPLRHFFCMHAKPAWLMEILKAVNQHEMTAVHLFQEAWSTIPTTSSTLKLECLTMPVSS